MQLSSPDTKEAAKAPKLSPSSLSVKNPAKKTAARTETTNTAPATRRTAPAAKWLTVFRRRGGWAELACVAGVVGSCWDCGGWVEPSLFGMLPSFFPP
jgi:hypothetical protein